MRLADLRKVFRAVWHPRETRPGEGFNKLMGAIESSEQAATDTISMLRQEAIEPKRSPAHSAVVAIVERFEG